MASVFKRSEDQGRRSSAWMISWHDAERGTWRACRGYTDKESSLAKGERLERAAARRGEGVVTDVEEQAARPIAQHAGEYVAKIRAGGRNERYASQVEQRLRLLAERTGAARVLDLDPVRILRAVSEHRYITKKNPAGRALSVAAKNEYLASVKSFTKWCAENRRVPHDPLAGLRKIDTKGAVKAHPRRALTPEELGRLLDAAERRPLQELLTVRTGASRGQPVANVRPAVREHAQRLGHERRLAYMIALWTGLRRGEVGALSWGDIDLDSALPHIRLRPETTKAKRADVLALHPQLAEALRQYHPPTATPGHLVLAAVPNMVAMRADLRLAGIDPGTRATGYVDLHSLRKSLSTMMAVAGMTSRTRQAQMRHTDPRLTENTYMDAALLPVASELQKVPAIPSPTAAAPEAFRIEAPTGKQRRTA